jgi:chromosome segregation ATPase
VKSIYADGGCGIEGTFHSIVGLEAASQICKMKLLKEENIKLKEENRRLRRLEDNNRRLKVEEHGVNSADELSILQNQLTEKEFELKQLSSEKDRLMMKLTEKQQQIKALEEYKTKSLVVENEIALLQDENITLMEKIEGGELFNTLEGLTTTATTTTTTEIGGSRGG